MATLLTSVNKTEGNYQDVFLYTINASFNGVNDEIKSARIEFSVPNTIDLYVGDVEYPFTSYNEETVGDLTTYTFYLDNINDLGIAIRLGLGAQFKFEAENGASFVLEPTLYVNDEILVESKSDEINLVAVARFQYDRTIILPTIAPTPGGAVLYQVTLENYGDIGATIDDVTFVIPSVDGLTIDTTYEIDGYDISSSAYADTSLDEQIGVVLDNEITFDMSSYRGEKYQFIYRGTISDTLQVGDRLVTTMDYSVGEELIDTDSISTLLGDEVSTVSTTIYGPQYSLADRDISYELSYSNDGNRVASDVVLTDELAPEITYTDFYSGTFYIGATNEIIDQTYSINYTTTNGESDTFGEFNTNTNEYVLLETFIDEGDNLATITWDIGDLPLGAQTQIAPQVNGFVNTDTAIGRTLVNHTVTTWDVDGTSTTDEKTFEVDIENTSSLSPVFTSNKTSIPQNPNATITYSLSASTRISRLVNPIFALFLPANMTYVGNETLDFTDYFGKDAPTLPPVYIEENFEDTGLTLVRFSFTGDYEYEFNQKTDFAINFDATINSDATGTVSTYLLLNTQGSEGVIDDGLSIYYDSNNLADDDTVSIDYAQTASISNAILFFLSVSSDKKVKGSLDTDYSEAPDVGNTIEGGELEYKIYVSNTGNANFTSVNIVDILPHIGDTGVVMTDEERLSAFSTYLKSDIIARILPDNRTASLKLSYSTSTNPLRFGAEYDIIGDEKSEWTETIPTDYTTVKSIMVQTDDETILPNETLEVTINASVPVGTNVDEIAWNTFAADVHYSDFEGNESRLLAIEPEKVGVKINEDPENTVRISGYSFWDTNSDGLFAGEEYLVDDVGVAVVSATTGDIVATAFTSPDASGTAGYYSIGNLPQGSYYLQFYIDTEEFRFSPTEAEALNGNKADSSGKTAVYDLTTTTSLENINVGFITKTSAYDIDTILEVNKSARSMVRNVIYNQMLIGMKHEDTIDLLNSL